MTTTITVALLEALLSADGSLRSQAEAALASLEVTQRIAGLLPHCHATATGSASNNASIATLSAVLLRRDIVKLTHVSPLEQLVEPLWELFSSSSNNNATAGAGSSSRLPALIGHCLAQVCASLALLNNSEDASCAAVVSQLLQRLESPCQQGHVEALELVANLAESAPRAILASPMIATTSLPTWYSPSWSPTALQAWNHALVQVAKATALDSSSSTPTLGGLASTTQNNLDELIVDPNSMAATTLGPSLLPLLEWMSNTTVAASQQQQQDVILAILQDWQQATTIVPSLLAGNPRVLQRLVGTCLQLSSSDITDVALQALFVLTSLLAVGAIKRTWWTSEMVTAMYQQAMPRCVQILQEVSAHTTEEDDIEWLHEPATLHSDGSMDDDDHDDDYYTFALELLGAFVGSLGGLSHVLPLAEQALQQPSQAKIGFSILRTVLQVAPVSVQPHIPTMVQACLHHASNSHTSSARIHYQILELWGDMAHTQSLPTEALPSILESLAMTISTTTTSSKIPARACRTLTFVAQYHAEDLTPILEAGDGFSQLWQVLIQGPLSLPHTTPGALAVKVRAVGAIAGLAQACHSSSSSSSDGSLFTPQYYAHLMPGLVGLLLDPTTPHELQTASLEAVTLVGQAVGVDLFGSDAHSLLQSWMLPQLQPPTNSENTSSSTLLLASARFAAVLQEDFHPYMPAVFPVLMQAIQASPDISIMVRTTKGGLLAIVVSDDVYCVKIHSI